MPEGVGGVDARREEGRDVFKCAKGERKAGTQRGKRKRGNILVYERAKRGSRTEVRKSYNIREKERRRNQGYAGGI